MQQAAVRNDGGSYRDSRLSVNVRDERGGQFVRRTAERVQHVPPLFARGCEYGPDDGPVGRAGPAAEAAGDLLLHLFRPHALFRQVIGGRNFRIDREHQRKFNIFFT